MVVKAGGQSFVLNLQETSDEDLKEMQMCVGSQVFGATSENIDTNVDALLDKFEAEHPAESFTTTREGYDE